MAILGARSSAVTCAYALRAGVHSRHARVMQAYARQGGGIRKHPLVLCGREAESGSQKLRQPVKRGAPGVTFERRTNRLTSHAFLSRVCWCRQMRCRVKEREAMATLGEHIRAGDYAELTK